MRTLRPLHLTNLNLMPVLRVLLREANVTRAAAHLGITQSAVSGSLARLRALLGDELLVRAGGAMRLTPRAEALRVRLERICEELEDLVQEETFAPQDAERTFVVATTDYEGLLIAPALLQTLSRVAPGVSVHLVDPPDRLPQRMAAGEIDLALVDWRLDHADVQSTRLTTDRIVGLVRNGHPLASITQPTQAQIEAYPHIGWHPGLDKRPGVNWRLAPERPARLQLMTQHFLMLPLVVGRTDTVAQAPLRLAGQIAQVTPLHVFELPYETRSIDTALVWSVVRQTDPAHRWFRDLLQRIVMEMTSETGLNP